MIKLYCYLFLMLLLAILLLAIPVFKNKNSRSAFLYTAFSFLVCALTLYVLFANLPALKQWMDNGQPHYQLLTQFNQLGGIDGAINRIKEKLAINPEDAKGWFILGKLYANKQDYSAALDALQKARNLEPHNAQVEEFYQIVLRQNPR